MDVGDAVRVISAPAEFYQNVSLNGQDPMMLGRQGRIISMAMNTAFEPGWRVELTNGGTKFFYEAELEVIEKIDGPPVSKTHVTPPNWYEDLEELEDKLFNVRVLGKELNDEFSDKDGKLWYDSEEQVEDKINKLRRGKK